MSKLKRGSIERAAREAQGFLVWVEANAAAIAGNACDWVDDGRQGIDYSAVRRGGQELTAPESAAEAVLSGRVDMTGVMADECWESVQKALYWAKRARRVGGGLVPAEDEGNRDASSAAAFKKKQGGAGPCIVCADPASGIGDDRLRAGRCNACRLYKLKHDVDRPKHLWEPK